MAHRRRRRPPRIARAQTAPLCSKSLLTPLNTQARVAAISQVAREEGSPLAQRAALAAAEDAEGDDELIA